jgi:integrase
MSVYLDKAKGWRYDFIQSGKRYSAGGFKTKRDARLAEARRREEVEKPKDQAVTDMAFLELLNLRLDHVRAYNSERHYKEYIYCGRRWAKRWGKTSCDEITERMINEYVLERRKVSPYTANKEIRYLRATFNFGKKKKYVAQNPLDGIEFFPEEKKVKYVPSIEDIYKVIAHADPDTQDYLWVIHETMARVSEVNSLTWEDVNLDARYIILYTRKKKGGHRTPRKIPMTSRLHGILSRRFAKRDPDKPWVFWHRYWSQKDGCYVCGQFQDRKKFMKTLCRKAGVRYFRFHALRHAGASILDGSNVPIGTIQRLLGHENRTTTEIYLHSVGNAERDAMRVFEMVQKKVPHQVPHHEKGATDNIM